MKKQILSLFVILCIIASITAMPINVSAASNGTCGENLTWTLDGEGTLTISGIGDMENWTVDNKSPWHESVLIKKVVINKGVTSISNFAFSYCISLTNITIPDSVTSIGEFAFLDCDSLESVNIADLTAWCNIRFLDVTSNPLYYAENLYLNNTLVTELIIPDNVISIDDYAFYGCSNLTSITIPDSVTSIGESAFSDCGKLYFNVSSSNQYFSAIDGVLFDKAAKTLLSYSKDEIESDYTIPDSVTSIGDCAFGYCGSLTNVTIPDSVTSIGEYAFGSCSSLTNIKIPDSVTSIGEMAFSICSKLTSITIPDGVTSIGRYAFSYCIGLTSITIPDSVTSIGNGAFNYCSKLTSITIPDSVTSIGSGAFKNCGRLTSITIPDGVTSIGDYLFGYCSSLTKITIPDSVTSIGNHAFWGCNSLTSITIPDSVTSIGDYAFYDCSSVTSITIPDSVTSIGNHVFDHTAYYNNSENRENGTLYIGHHSMSYINTTIKDGIFMVTPNDVPSGSHIILIYYNDGKLANIGKFEYSDSNTGPFFVNEKYDEVKVYVWDKDGKLISESEAKSAA